MTSKKVMTSTNTTASVQLRILQSRRQQILRNIQLIRHNRHPMLSHHRSSSLRTSRQCLIRRSQLWKMMSLTLETSNLCWRQHSSSSTCSQRKKGIRSTLSSIRLSRQRPYMRECIFDVDTGTHRDSWQNIVKTRIKSTRRSGYCTVWCFSKVTKTAYMNQITNVYMSCLNAWFYPLSRWLKITSEECSVATMSRRIPKSMIA